MDIQDKVVILTGATEGIGLATARLLAQNGARLVLAARTVDRSETLAEELRQQGAQALAVPTDVRDPAQVDRLVGQSEQRFGGVDVLINNAGQSIAGPVAALDLEQVHQIYTLNLFGAIHAMQAVLPAMRRQGGGLILNISSMTSRMSIPGLAGYASSKAALNLVSATARAELAPDNIRVILVLPRTTATNFGKNALGDQALRQRQRQDRPGIVVDPPEFVAEKILEAVRTEPAEQLMTS